MWKFNFSSFDDRTNRQGTVQFRSLGIQVPLDVARDFITEVTQRTHLICAKNLVKQFLVHLQLLAAIDFAHFEAE